MSGYQFTAQALEDLFDISNVISQDNPSALRVRSFVRVLCLPILGSPDAPGQTSPSCPCLSRVVQPFTRYFLVYDADSKPLRILRILHAARDLKNLL